MGSVPAYSHIVVVVMENHNYSEIAGNTAQAPYINSLMAGGANLTNMSAIMHPSQPNYFALYAGSTFGTTDDNQYSETGPTIDTILQANGLTFQGYVDTTGGGSDFNHDPWVSFPEGYSVQTDFTSFPALFASGNYASLPSVSFVIPSITNDMHSGTIQAGDSWLQANLGAYAQWAKANNSLLVVTWDESNDASAQTTNQIPTILYGANVVPGNYNTAYNDYNLTSTIMAAFNLTGPNNAATAAPIQVFGTAAVAPSITTPANGSTDTTTTQPVISGVGVTSDILTVSIDGTVAGTATVANSAWTFTPATALSNGSHTITATQAAAGGASSTAATDTFTVNVPVVPPAPTITTPANGSIDTTTTLPVMSGGGVTGDTVTVNIDGVDVGTALVVNSAWSFTPATALANSSHTITATQAATGGPSSAAAADTFMVNVSYPPAAQAVHANDISLSGGVTGPYNFIDLLNLQASYADLINAFGTNEQAMQNWFNAREAVEQRPDSFDGLDYIASYGDLINAFKGAGSIQAVLDAGAEHYITNGHNEGRTTTFNGLDYIASYADLIKAFGVDGDAGAYHYIEHGVSEGRTTTFDGLDYIASYTDLIKAFGANEQAGAAHYISYGYNEGRATTFDGLDYIAGYTDLMKAFGANNDAGATHYIDYGLNEGRSAAPFNVAAYESAHPDLNGKYASDDAFLTAYINTYATSGKFLT